MKKRIIAIIIVTLILVTVLSGCGIITENRERNLNQIVAKVGNVNIRKSQLRDAYINMGYQFAEYYSQEESVNLTLEVLIKKELNINDAINGDNKVVPEGGAGKLPASLALDDVSKKSSLAQEAYDRIVEMSACFTQKEIDLMEWELWTSKLSILKTFEKEHKEDFVKVSSISEANKKELPTEITEWEDRAYRTNPNDSSAIIGVIPVYPATGDNTEYEAYQSYVGRIKLYYGYGVNEYEINLFKAKMEDALIVKHQEVIDNKTVAHYETESGKVELLATINDAYNNFIAQQKAVFQNDQSQFVSFLENATDGSMVLFNAKGGYALVKNLLISYDPITSEYLNSLKGMDISEDSYKAIRNKFAEAVELKDLRSKIIANPLYDSTYLATDLFNNDGSYKTEIFDNDGNLKDNWQDSYTNRTAGKNDMFILADASVYPVNESGNQWMPYDNVTVKNSGDNIKNYLADAMRVLKGEATINDVAAYNYQTKPLEWRDKSLDNLDYDDVFIDLMYKYNTDPGMLGSLNPNYVVTPGIAAGQQSQWVPEFQKEINDLVSQIDDLSSTPLEDRMVTITTDYGIHVVLVNHITISGQISGRIINADDLDIPFTPTNALKERIFETEKANVYQRVTNDIFAKAMAASGEVTIYTKTFKNFYKDNVEKW